MKSADGKSFVYEKSQLVEVICQLRFPTILSIESEEPARFQDRVREDFPRYAKQVENLPPVNGQAQTVNNYSFISEDGKYKISLTKNFFALSTMAYTSWEDFAGWLDEPLGQFISTYKPAYFERVGLRYVNGFSREKLELTGRRWNDLVQSQYLGPMDSDSVDESAFSKCSIDVEMTLEPGISAKMHAGPGYIKRTVRTPQGLQNVQEQEARFIFDQDIYAGGNIKLPAAAETLEKLHGHADTIFSEAITNVLHDAMEPVFI